MKTSRMILIYHSEVPADAPADEQDVLHESAVVAAALVELGYTVEVRPFLPDLRRMVAEITELRPLLIFNLVETMFGSGRLIGVAPLLFEQLGVLYSGCSSDAIYLTSNKLLARRIMQSAGLPVAPALTVTGEQGVAEPARMTAAMNSDYEQAVVDAAESPHGYLLKSIWEHGSSGLDEATLELHQAPDEIFARLATANRFRSELFAERYIEGREINVALLGASSAPELLPPAEIIFENYPAQKLRVVGYRSKWDVDSFEYHHTPRRWLCSEEEPELIAELNRLALECWRRFGLRGYARVDFRVTPAGEPIILEVNTNPCLAPEAGFLAAARESQLSPCAVVERIVESTLRSAVTV